MLINPYMPILNLIVIIFFTLAFLTADIKVKIILAAVMALLFILPHFFPIPALGGIYFIGKIIFGVGCYIFIRWHGYL